MSRTLHLDRETYCDLDLKVIGTAKYADHCEDLLVIYALDDGPIQCWDVTADPYCPDDLHEWLSDPEVIVLAHNAFFDRMVHQGTNQRHLPQVPLSRWECTMAQALSHALPASLGELGRVLGLPDSQAKDKDGKRLIQLFTKPQPANRKVRRATRLTHPEDWQKFINYGISDVEAMRECRRRMPKWNWTPECIEEWRLDQTVNERGFLVDRELTQAGILAAETEKARIAVRFRELTGGVVDRPSLRQPFMALLNDRFGLDLDNTQGETFQRLIDEGGVDPVAVELMQLSMMSNKTSTAKYAKLDPMVQEDGRFRGALQFAGAGRTRRWAGRGPQFHNLPARGLPSREAVEMYVEMLKVQQHDLYFEDLMKYGAAAIRNTVIAGPGNKIVAADLSNIEGRMLSWLAQEHWKLKAFREFDAGTGPDLYKITAASMLGGSPWDVSKKDRNVFGKVPDLASGFAGGVAGYQTFGRVYGVLFEDYWGTIQEMIEAHHVAQAWANLNKWGREQQETMAISEIEWVASETCKLKWRSRHPATVGFWKELQNAAKAAIINPGSTYQVGPYLKVKKVKFLDQSWLVIRLPSGRYLTYFEPHILKDGTLCYWGDAAEEGKTTRQWVRCFTHGGKITGNCLSQDTLVVTQSGLVPIAQVTAEHRVWDGVEWVSCDGVLSQGKKAVGEWLKVKITQDHLIHDGNSWRPVMQLDAAYSHAALLSAASSVLSLSFAVTPQTAALQIAFANAGLPSESTSDNSGAARACGAESAQTTSFEPDFGKITISSPTTRCVPHGLIATKLWCVDAMTQATLRTTITAAEGSSSGRLGSQIDVRFSSTSKHSTGGMNPASTLTERKTIKATCQATSGLSPGASTPTTLAAIECLNTEVGDGRFESFGDVFARTGVSQPTLAATSISAEPLSGLWVDTTETIEVFDLLNCGPRNRFTIITAAGPVVVHNCCQTVARDVLMSGMDKASREGYDLILTVHDEAIAEVPDTPDYNVQRLIEMLATNDAWNQGLPLSADGFEAAHYLKED